MNEWDLVRQQAELSYVFELAQRCHAERWQLRLMPDINFGNWHIEMKDLYGNHVAGFQDGSLGEAAQRVLSSLPAPTVEDS